MSVDLATLGIRVDASQVNKADRDLEHLEKTGRKVENTAKNMGAALAGAFLGLGIVEVTRKAIAMADTYANMQGRLGLVTKGTAELGVVTQRLYDISQRSRGSFEATSDLYAKLAQATQQLKVGQTDLLQVTETISKALVVSGAGAQESAGALRQLGQAFASGALRGDELNSIMESTPRLARAIAEGMGITIGQLRKLGSEGKLTGSAIFDALISQQQVIEQEFSKMPTTVGQAFVLLGNASLKFVGEANEAMGVTRALADAIKFLSENLDGAIMVVGVLGAAILAVLAPAIAASITGFATMTVTMIGTTTAAIANNLAMLATAASISATGTAAGVASSALGVLRAAFAVLLPLGFVALLAAAAGAILYIKATSLDAAEATQVVKGSTETYNNSLQSLIAYQDKAGLSTKGTTAALDASLGITQATTSAADAAGAAALRRAAAERTLATEILRRAAAEMTADAGKLGAAADISRYQGTAIRAPNAFMENLAGAAPGAAGVVGRRLMQGVNQQSNDQATAKFRESANLSSQEAALLARAASLSAAEANINAAPLRPMSGVTPTVSGGGDDKKRGGRTAGISEEARELEQATNAAKEYAAQLEIETAGIGQNTVQQRMAAVERAALLAPTELLAKSIRDAGEAWKTANQNAASDELVKSLKAANDQQDFETSLLGMNAKQREVANAQRFISAALAEAEAEGVDISSDAIRTQTEALLKNAEARGEVILASERADAFADRIAAINDQVHDATDGIRGLFGTFGEGLANLTETWSDYGSHVADILAEIAQNQGEGEEASRRRGELEGELARAEIDNYGNMLGAAKSFFDEKTGAYKILQAAEQAYRIYQFAMAVQAMFLDTAETTTSVANSGVRMAADGAETASSVAKSGIRAAADGVAAFAKTLASLPFPFNLAAGAVVLAALVGVGIAMKGGGGAKGASSAGAGSSTRVTAREAPSSYTPFISQDRAANENSQGGYRGGGNSIEPVLTRAEGERMARQVIFDFKGANFSNANPADIQKTIKDTFNNEIKDNLLADAREQSAEDMKSLGRQRLGGK